MVHSSLQRSEDFNSSKFYMWRCVVAMAHADGLVQQEESDYLTTLFKNMRERAGLPEDHYETLLDDLKHPQDMMELLPYINDPQYRSQVIYFARLLAHKDGKLDPSEEDLLNKLHVQLTDGLDMDAIREEVQKNVQQELVIHDVKIDEGRPMTGLFGLLDQIMLHYGIDLMDE
ncbi:MAG: hypothetical protein GC204_20885 [Chloroflexi bacterium]|nr:hypothetical protein [Chloroflexota bacterium]